MASSCGEDGTSWKTVEGHGKRAIYTWNEGVFHSQKSQRQRRFGKMPRGRGKKEHNVSGSRSLLSGRFWSRSEQMKKWDVVLKSCGKGASQ